MRTSAVTKRSPSPNSSITPLDGFSTLGKSTSYSVQFHLCGNFPLSNCFFLNRLGVPYHSWRITHAKHHASTGHMTQDQVFLPKTRSQRGLPEFNPEKETLDGSSISNDIMNEFWEALGDSPIGAACGAATYLVRLFIPQCHAFTNVFGSSSAGPCT